MQMPMAHTQFFANWTEFKLRESFVEQYKTREVPWGFGDLSYITYKRSYARPLDLANPHGPTEEWWQTCRRVIEGVFSTYATHDRFHGIDPGSLLPEFFEAPERTAEEMFDRMFNMKWLPPGRGLFAMGTSAMREKGAGCLNNCMFVSTKGDIPSAMRRLMDFSMLGVGVGFDTQGEGREVYLPEVDGSIAPYIVEDTREGWCDVVYYILRRVFNGGSLTSGFKFGAIRPKGAPLRTFGGTASGPEPLIALVTWLLRHFGCRVTRVGLNLLVTPRKAAEASPLTELDILDIGAQIGHCVVMGGIRRSALICLGKADGQIPTAKNDIGDKLWRYRSNNSAKVRVGDDYRTLAAETQKFGEPGYFWLELARSHGRLMDPPDYEDAQAEGTNPCVTADTLVMTDQGPRRADTLLGSAFNAVIEGEIYPSTHKGFFKTGYKPVFLLETEEGHRLKLTEEHEVLTALKVTQKKRYEGFVPARDLKPGDTIVLNHPNADWGSHEGTTLDFDRGWLLGSLLGDGHFHEQSDSAKLEYWGDSAEYMVGLAFEALHSLDNERTGLTRDLGNVPDRNKWNTSSRPLKAFAHEWGIDQQKQITNDKLATAPRQMQAGFLRGLFDADGSVQGTQEHGVSVRLASVSMQHLLLAQQMLLNLGVNSTLYPNRQDEGYRLLPDGKGGEKEYFCQALHELIIANDNLQRYAQDVGFHEPAKQAALAASLLGYKRAPNRDRFVATVKGLTYLGMENVYDCTIPGPSRFSANGITIHNCVEQTLWDNELCCLVETFPARCTDAADFQRTLMFAYLYAKAVTLLPTHDPIVNEVIAKNRRMGVSLAGVVQALEKFGNEPFFKMLDEGYQFLKQYDLEFSMQVGVNPSRKLTSVKPGGTVPLLAGATPGMHWDHAPFYIRRERFSDDSPYLKDLAEAGYELERCEDDPSSVAVSFLIKSGESTHKPDVSAGAQLLLAAKLQEVWADNQVSVTVHFRPEESVLGCLLDFDGKLKGVAFLPYFDDTAGDMPYKQLPYETISSETYARMYEKVTPLANRGVHGGHEKTDAYCDSDRCVMPG